ncbi:hypothetical protein G9P44_002709 [Scheffersomyces stipitis]|nr:hypothetical protein G9P44_002709 [Scheffersomyces stipitis]
MSSTFRPRRVVPNAVNTPILTKIQTSSSINNSEAEQILSEFIYASEAVAASFTSSSLVDNEAGSATGFSDSAGSNALLSQLKRVQRDLRGLPPLVAEPTAVVTSSRDNKKIKFDDDDVEVEEPKNKKIKFDSEEPAEEVPEYEEEQEEKQEEQEQEEVTVIEEEESEKKHKKEKKEKKQKKEKKEKKHKKEDKE